MSTPVSAYAQAERLPTRLRRERICRLAGYGKFCASCPDIVKLPCVQAGIMRDCDDCREQGCPCMISSTRERRKAFKAWRTHHDWANAVTRERTVRYRSRRRAESARERATKSEYHTRLGRICAWDGCDVVITDRSKSGLCVKHCKVGRSRGTYCKA